MSAALALKLTVLCSGVDAAGKPFEERTRTTAVEKRGGRLLTQHLLKKGSHLQLRLLARPDEEAEVEIVKAMETGNEDTEWNFQFLVPVENFRGLRFPAGTAATSSPESIDATTALAGVTEELVLLRAHADDHLRHCTQEIDTLRERFTRELQGAMDTAGRQLQQLARSTIQTTFRSLLEDLAHRAEETVDENLKRLREAVDQTGVQHAKYLDEEAETQLQRFQERLEKQGRQLTTRLEQLRVEGDRALQQASQAALANFQAGCADLLRDLLHSAETAKPSHPPVRPPAARRK